jgi:hypothetical protein
VPGSVLGSAKAHERANKEHDGAQEHNGEVSELQRRQSMNKANAPVITEPARPAVSSTGPKRTTKKMNHAQITSAGSAAGEQWEYTTRWHQFQPSDSYLNAMGAEGWELVAFNKASSQVWSSGWVFKRRRVQPPNDSR